LNACAMNHQMYQNQWQSSPCIENALTRHWLLDLTILRKIEWCGWGATAIPHMFHSVQHGQWVVVLKIGGVFACHTLCPQRNCRSSKIHPVLPNWIPGQLSARAG
jgi:hypothetical protein